MYSGTMITAPPITVDRIIDVALRYFDNQLTNMNFENYSNGNKRYLHARNSEGMTNMEKLKSGYRYSELVEIRQFIFYYVWANTEISNSIVARSLNKDHSTGIHARKQVENQLEVDNLVGFYNFTNRYQHFESYMNINLKFYNFGK